MPTYNFFWLTPAHFLLAFAERSESTCENRSGDPLAASKSQAGIHHDQRFEDARLSWQVRDCSLFSSVR